MPRLSAAAALLLALMVCLAPLAQEARIVTGQTPGLDPGARERAIELAIREAVLQAIQEIVPTPRITPYEPLLERAGEFLASMRILDYDTRDGLTRIEIAALLHEAALRAAIADAWLKQAPSPPRVVVLAAVRNENEPYAVLEGNMAQGIAEEILEGAGMTVVGLEALTQHEDPESLAGMLESEDGVRGLARAHLSDAAIILLVTVSAESLGLGSNLFECKAHIRAIVGAPHAEAPVQTHEAESLLHGAEPDEAAEVAIESGIQRVMPLIRPMVILAAASSDRSNQDIIVTVEGRLDSTALRTLQEHFAAIPGVEAVEVLIHGARGSRFRVQYPSSPGGFIEPALAALPPMLPLEVVQIIDRDMQLRLNAPGN